MKKLAIEEDETSAQIQCTACEFTSEFDRIFRHGVEQHQIFICVCCSSNFKFAKELMVHLYREHRIPPQRFLSDKEFIRCGGEDTILCCVECNKLFDISDGVESTLENHDCEKSTTNCTSCGKQVLTGLLDRHGKYCTAESPANSEGKSKVVVQSKMKNRAKASATMQTEADEVSITIVPEGLVNGKSTDHHQYQNYDAEGVENGSVGGEEEDDDRLIIAETTSPANNHSNDARSVHPAAEVVPYSFQQKKTARTANANSRVVNSSSRTSFTPTIKTPADSTSSGIERPRRNARKVANDDFMYENLSKRSYQRSHSMSSASHAKDVVQQSQNNGPRGLRTSFSISSSTGGAHSTPKSGRRHKTQSFSSSSFIKSEVIDSFSPSQNHLRTPKLRISTTDYQIHTPPPDDHELYHEETDEEDSSDEEEVKLDPLLVEQDPSKRLLILIEELCDKLSEKWPSPDMPGYTNNQDFDSTTHDIIINYRLDDKYEDEILMQMLNKAALHCTYCRQVKLIRIDKRQLAIHLFSKHNWDLKFTPLPLDEKLPTIKIEQEECLQPEDNKITGESDKLIQHQEEEGSSSALCNSTTKLESEQSTEIDPALSNITSVSNSSSSTVVSESAESPIANPNIINTDKTVEEIENVSNSKSDEVDAVKISTSVIETPSILDERQESCEKKAVVEHSEESEKVDEKVSEVDESKDDDEKMDVDMSPPPTPPKEQPVANVNAVSDANIKEEESLSKIPTTPTSTSGDDGVFTSISHQPQEEEPMDTTDSCRVNDNSKTTTEFDVDSQDKDKVPEETTDKSPKTEAKVENLIPVPYIDMKEFKQTVLRKVFQSKDVLFSYKDEGMAEFGEAPCECLLCGFFVESQKNLFPHWRKIHRGVAMKCAMCQGRFLFAGALYSHLCLGTPNPIIKNELDRFGAAHSGGKHPPPNALPDSNGLNNGEFQIVDPKDDDGSADTIVLRYQCNICDDVQLPGFFNYMIHLRKEHNKCELCLESMNNQKELEHHMKKHKLNHFCWKCGVTYCAKPNFMTHLFWKHGSESKECSICLKKKWPHIYHFCVPPTAFVCESCGFYFTKPKCLMVHRRLHTGEKLRKCPKHNCFEKFISKKLLERHLEMAHIPNLTLPLPSSLFLAADSTTQEHQNYDENSDDDKIPQNQPCLNTSETENPIILEQQEEQTLLKIEKENDIGESSSPKEENKPDDESNDIEPLPLTEVKVKQEVTEDQESKEEEKPEESDESAETTTSLPTEILPLSATTEGEGESATAEFNQASDSTAKILSPGPGSIPSTDQDAMETENIQKQDVLAEDTGKSPPSAAENQEQEATENIKSGIESCEHSPPPPVEKMDVDETSLVEEVEEAENNSQEISSTVNLVPTDEPVLSKEEEVEEEVGVIEDTVTGEIKEKNTAAADGQAGQDRMTDDDDDESKKPFNLAEVQGPNLSEEESGSDDDDDSSSSSSSDEYHNSSNDQGSPIEPSETVDITNAPVFSDIEEDVVTSPVESPPEKLNNLNAEISKPVVPTMDMNITLNDCSKKMENKKPSNSNSPLTYPDDEESFSSITLKPVTSFGALSNGFIPPIVSDFDDTTTTNTKSPPQKQQLSPPPNVMKQVAADLVLSDESDSSSSDADSCDENSDEKEEGLDDSEKNSEQGTTSMSNILDHCEKLEKNLNNSAMDVDEAALKKKQAPDLLKKVTTLTLDLNAESDLMDDVEKLKNTEDFGSMSPLLPPLDDFNFNVTDIPTFEDNSLPEHIIRENAMFSIIHEHDYCLRLAVKRRPSSPPMSPVSAASGGRPGHRSPRKGDLIKPKKLKIMKPKKHSPTKKSKKKKSSHSRKRHHSSSSSSSSSSSCGSCGSNCSCSSSSSSSSSSSGDSSSDEESTNNMNPKHPPYPKITTLPLGPPVKRGRGRPKGSVNRNKDGLPTAKKRTTPGGTGKRIGRIVVPKPPKSVGPDGLPTKRKYRKNKGKFSRKSTSGLEKENLDGGGGDNSFSEYPEENYILETDLETDESGSEEIYNQKQLCEVIGKVPAFDEIWTMSNEQYLLKFVRGVKDFDELKPTIVVPSPKKKKKKHHGSGATYSVQQSEQPESRLKVRNVPIKPLIVRRNLSTPITLGTNYSTNFSYTNANTTPTIQPKREGLSLKISNLSMSFSKGKNPYVKLCPLSPSEYRSQESPPGSWIPDFNPANEMRERQRLLKRQEEYSMGSGYPSSTTPSFTPATPKHLQHSVYENLNDSSNAHNLNHHKSLDSTIKNDGIRRPRMKFGLGRGGGRKGSTFVPQQLQPSTLPTENNANSEPLYCMCQSPHDNVSQMIGCDSKDCEFQWFHFECVGVVTAPKGKWYCPDCRERRKKRALILSKRKESAIEGALQQQTYRPSQDSV